MAAKTTLNAKTLEALGAARLAELLLELGTGNAAVKRRLKLELASARSPAEAGREIGKRLASIAKSQSFVEWPKHKELVADLDGQRRAIIDHVAKADAAEAFDLMWRFLALANSVYRRCDDSNGDVSDVFTAAMSDLGAIASAAKPEPDDLAQRIFEALKDNHYGQYDDLIATLAAVLGGGGLEHLKGLVVAFSKQPRPKPAEKDRKVIGWGSGGKIYADEIEDRHHASLVTLALQEIADLQGDVDGFIAQESPASRTAPAVATDIAQRLLTAGRKDEALAAIDAARQDAREGGHFPEWEETRAAVLEALGRSKEAQDFRWTCFTRSLIIGHLRAYLKQLPDFDDVEAEGRAMDVAVKHQNAELALAFLIAWPALAKAAQLVQDRAKEFDGNFYELLSPAAEALEGKFPLAATILRRAMIDDTLGGAKSSRYKHAARHLLECESQASSISDYGGIATHQDYVKQLKELHGRKPSFWENLKKA